MLFHSPTNLLTTRKFKVDSLVATFSPKRCIAENIHSLATAALLFRWGSLLDRPDVELL